MSPSMYQEQRENQQGPGGARMGRGVRDVDRSRHRLSFCTHKGPQLLFWQQESQQRAVSQV